MTSIDSSLPSTSSIAATGDDIKAPLTCELYNIKGNTFPLDYLYVDMKIANPTASTNTKERKVANDRTIHLYLGTTQQAKLKAKLSEPTTPTNHPMDMHMLTYDGAEFGHLWKNNKTNYFGDAAPRDVSLDFARLRWPADRNYKPEDHVMLFLQSLPRHYSEQISSEMQEFHTKPFQTWLRANAANLKLSFILVIHPTVLPVYLRAAIKAYEVKFEGATPEEAIKLEVDFFKQLFYQVHVVVDPYAYFVEYYCGFQEPSQPEHLICTLESEFRTNHFLNIPTANTPSSGPSLREKVAAADVMAFGDSYRAIKFEVDSPECEVKCSTFIQKDTSNITIRLLGNAAPCTSTHHITEPIPFEGLDTDPLLEAVYFYNAVYNSLIEPHMSWSHKLQYYFERKDYDKMMTLFAKDAILGKVYDDYKTKSCPLNQLVESYVSNKLKDVKARTLVSYTMGIVDQIYQLVDKMFEIDSMIAKEPLNRFKAEFNQARKGVVEDDDDTPPPRAAQVNPTMTCGVEAPRRPPPPKFAHVPLAPTPSC